MQHRPWLAFHIFYASDASPIITECVQPFVETAREAGCLQQWFFIRYWLEGPHLRVRLLPAPGADRDALREGFFQEVEAFLKRRPALYDADTEVTRDLYRKMFLVEYGEDEWDRQYGPDGEMPMRENNTVAEFLYEPEYSRYGGEVGIPLAEWHFERSSEMVSHLVRTTNTHVRPLLLGLGMQLSLTMAYAFLKTDEAVGRFFLNYRNFWETSFDEPSDDYHENFDKSFALCEVVLKERMELTRSQLHSTLERLGATERRWHQHCLELRHRVRAVVDQLDFGDRPLPEDPEARWEAVAVTLLSSYIHMTNNRLGVAILDEIYLSYLVERALGVELVGAS